MAEADPYHAILADPWRYEVVGLNYQAEDTDGPYIDLTLKKGDEVRRLRFLGPQEFEVETGFPSMTSGLFIADVRGRGMEDIGVRVDSFEPSPGAVRFWAKGVVEIEVDPDG